METGEIVRQFTGHEGPVRDVVFGPNGLTAYSVAEDSRMFYWDLESGVPIRVEDLTVGVYSLDLSPDGRYSLLGMLDSRVVLWIHYYGQVALDLLGHTGRVETVAFTPDGLQAISGAVNQVQFSPDDRFALSGGDDLIILWDIETGLMLRRYTGHVGGVMGIAFSPDGHTFLRRSGRYGARVARRCDAGRFIGLDRGKSPDRRVDLPAARGVSRRAPVRGGGRSAIIVRPSPLSAGC